MARCGPVPFVLRLSARRFVGRFLDGKSKNNLKPANVMLVADPALPGGERAKLLDFGIVKILQGPDRLQADSHDGPTRNGMVLGTPRYMAPEQWKCGGRIDARTDVYALGVITFLGLSGELPFHAVDAPELGMMHCYKMAPNLASINPSLPPALVDLVARMLEKDSDRRPSMSAVAETMGRYLPRHGASDKLPCGPGSSDVEIAICDPAERTEKLAIEDLLLDDNAAELTQPLLQIRERPTRLISLASLAPHRHPEFSADASPEPSEGSLLVGSNDNLRRPHGPGSWIAGGTAVALALAAVYFMIQLRPASRADFDAGQAVVSPAAAQLLATRPAPRAAPPSPTTSLSGKQTLTKLRAKKSAGRHLPNLSCMRTPSWSRAEQEMLLRAFVRSEAKLYPEESLVLRDLAQAPRLHSVPRSMSRRTRGELVKELRRISALFSGRVPMLVEVRCPK
jgi:hypothetical protein